MNQIIKLSICAVLAASSVSHAAEGPAPVGISHLDHVFLIMMENHGASQILNNPNAPYTNQLAASANLATNFFAIGHPSLTNYLEVVGGSNFGVHSDNYPSWHDASCSPNLATGIPSTDTPATSVICPISGTGIDAATPAVDITNEVQGYPGENNIDGIKSIPAAQYTVGKSIADQLVEHGLSYKSYQESLPFEGADYVNVSDGFYTNNTNFSAISPTLTPPLSAASLVSLYAVKHNPFAYFSNVQSGQNPHNSLKNTVSFDGERGLYADLGSGHVPHFSFIVPNQCNDQHGRGNAGAFCNYDPASDGSQASLNPALIARGDMTLKRLVTAIKHSEAWHEGRNVIIVMWDENDYSTAPNINKVATIVETNYGSHGVKSANYYNHFSMLKSIEAGFHLPCLNHACDSNVEVMSDLFGNH